MNSNDIELLRRYVFERSEAAFGDLVRQHIALVYSAALRQTNGDAPLAEDVTQVVFTDLARKAARLTRHTSLAGWLYTSTRYAAAGLRRAEQRRSAREQEAHAMNQLLQAAGTDPAWEQLRPVLDEAMHDLKADDREAVLLRYFERLPLAVVGTRLGVTENTARMRVERALDKLRSTLVKRGVTSTAGAVAVALAGHAAGAAPIGMAAVVSGKAVATAGAGSAFSVLLARFLMSTKFKLLAGTAALAILVTPLVWHWEGPSQGAATIPQSVEPASAVSPAQADAASASDNSATQANSPTMTNASALRLTILAADANKPVAAVEVVCTTKKDKEQTREKFISRRDGICDVYYPKDTDTLELVSQTDGFADTMLHWEPAKGDTIPTNYVLRLVRAVHIGGYVRAEDGSPVAGAKVEFGRNGVREDPAMVLAHENHEFKRMEAVADSDGRWSLDRMAPEVFGRAGAFVNHPDYLFKIELFEKSEAQEQLRKDAFVFKLSPAPKVRGTVVDAQGNPISGAQVIVGEYKSGGGGPFEEESTLADGSFVAKHDQPGATRISFRAKGFVPKVLKLDANTDPGPLQVVLQTGRSLRLRVVDQTGRPVSQADVIADLEGTASATLASTDAEGKATVHVAADGGTAAYISAAGFKSASVAAPAADGEERTIALAKEARVAVSGAVTDASTGQPLPAFRIVCGTPYVIDPSSANPPFTVSPRSGDWHKFGGGKFRLAMDQFLEYNWDARNRGFMLKFEADGYASSVSRLIHTNESDVQLEVALVPAQTVNVTVLNPDGRPAADADVGLLRPGVTMSLMVAGHLNLPGFSTGLLRPDSKGAFLLPPDDSIKRVIAINSQGFAEASFAALSREPILQLQPLGRLEGQWLVRNQPAPGRGLVLGVASIDGAGYTLDCSATTDSEGRFTFAQVPAGKYRLTWNESTKENGVTTSKDLAGVEVRPGETSTVTVGGYVVNLRLRWPADFVPGKSTRISVAMHTPSLAPPATIMQDRQAVIQWSQSPEIQAKLRDYRSYEFVEGAGGLWTAEPVQAGTAYTLEAMVGDGAATNGSPALVAYGQMSVTIPADPPTGQFDAGELLVQSVESAPARAGVR